MNRPGHIGASLLLVTPLVILTSVVSRPLVGLSLYIPALIVCRLPDQIESAFGLPHRSYGHTVFWVGVVSLLGAGFSLLMLRLGGFNTSVSPILLGVSIGAAVSLSLLSHLGADIITVGGDYTVKPWYPLSHTSYQLRWTTADNPYWNGGLLLSGGLALIGTVTLIIG
jgi:membrane-bound metal-dependent hydrolase YbcI (DUF457 family)